MATVAAPGGGAAKIAGFREAMIAPELKTILFTAALGLAGGGPATNWRFLTTEPFRPKLTVSLLLVLLMAVATNAATEKHVRTILRVEMVMMW